MVTILCEMNPNFDHVRDQILIVQGVHSMENLMTRLLHVPTLKSRNIQEYVESFALISICGRGGCDTVGGHLRCTYCRRMGHTQENCYS